MDNFYSDDDHDLVKLYRLFASLFADEPDEKTLIEAEEMFATKFSNTSDEIRADFTYLFSDREGLLPPCESLYNHPIWDKPKFGGPVADELQKFYHSAGLVMDEEMDIPPDHLSAELLFMSYLIEDDLIELQEGFLEEHLAVWVPDFCEEIKRYARTTFYSRISDFLRELIRDECKDFGIDEIH
jgi:TorA maturation chaperone TorD